MQNQQISVLTYNVNFGTFRFWEDDPKIPRAAELAAQAIRRANADVVILQETNRGWERYFSEVLIDMYPQQAWHKPNVYYYESGGACLCKATVLLVETHAVPTGVKGSFWAFQMAHVRWRSGGGAYPNNTPLVKEPRGRISRASSPQPPQAQLEGQIVDPQQQMLEGAELQPKEPNGKINRSPQPEAEPKQPNGRINRSPQPDGQSSGGPSSGTSAPVVSPADAFLNVPGGGAGVEGQRVEGGHVPPHQVPAPHEGEIIQVPLGPTEGAGEGTEGVILAPTAVHGNNMSAEGQPQIQTGTVITEGEPSKEIVDSTEGVPEGELEIVTVPYAAADQTSGSGSGGELVKDFVFVNAHLRPPVGMGTKVSLGNDAVMLFYKAGGIHIKELEALVAHGNEWVPGAATIILGDFNEGKWGKTVRGLKAKPVEQRKAKWAKGLARRPVCGGGWKDALKSVKGSRVTWHWTVPGGLTLTNNYDHIFFKPDRLKLRECTIFDGFWDASDHLPVKAEFDILS